MPHHDGRVLGHVADVRRHILLILPHGRLGKHLLVRPLCAARGPSVGDQRSGEATNPPVPTAAPNSSSSCSSRQTRTASAAAHRRPQSARRPTRSCCARPAPPRCASAHAQHAHTARRHKGVGTSGARGRLRRAAQAHCRGRGDAAPPRAAWRLTSASASILFHASGSSGCARASGRVTGRPAMPPASEMRLGLCLSRSLGKAWPWGDGHTECRMPCVFCACGAGRARTRADTHVSPPPVGIVPSCQLQACTTAPPAAARAPATAAAP